MFIMEGTLYYSTNDISYRIRLIKIMGKNFDQS
jgi:hypothetical protein